MKVAKTVVRWVLVLAFLLCIVEFPRGEVKSQTTTAMEPIHVFKWSTYGSHLQRFFYGLFHLSLGTTLATGRALPPLVFQSALRTMAILGVALVFVLILGVAKGIYDGLHSERQTVGRAASAWIHWIIESIPDFALIIALVSVSYWLAANSHIRVFLMGDASFGLGTLLPALLLSLVPMMHLARSVRNRVLEQYGQSYLVTARAKGMPARVVLLRHLLPNCLQAISDTLVPVVAMLFSGLVMIEYLMYQHGLLFGLFDAMGNSGSSPSYGVPMQTASGTVAVFTNFQRNKVLGYLAGMFLLFVIAVAVLRLILLSMGYRKVRNPYASPLRDDARSRRRDVQLWTGIVMLALLVFAAIFVNYLGLPDPNQWDVIHFKGTTITTPPYPPSPLHWLGSDQYGRDLLSRAIHDTMPTFMYGGIAAVGLVAFAALLGMLSSVTGWRPIRFVIETWNSLFSIIPGIAGALLILEIPAVYYVGLHFMKNGNSWWDISHAVICLAVIAFVECGRVAAAVQANLDEALAKDYIEAARIAGNSRWTQFVLHLWRPLYETVLELLLVEFNRVIILVSILGFFQINLGQAWMKTMEGWVYLDSANDWGGLFSDNAHSYLSEPWVLLAPALFVAWTVFGVNLVLESLRRRLRSVPAGRHHQHRPAISRAMRLLASASGSTRNGNSAVSPESLRAKSR